MENEISLADSIFETDKKIVKKKMLKFPTKPFLKILLRKSISFFRRLKIKNRVYFHTVRGNKEPEGNMAALYPLVKSKKVLFAHRHPHNPFQLLKIYYYTYTSKVIVTDDYDGYLRYFPLKKDQRVIQIWHACGAFKKFALDGTNLKRKTELATHVQYNLACVSGESVCQIYADAFDIPKERVRALGVPRTDMFFDEEYAKNARNKIYEKYPEFEDKRIILYAPTFRGNPKERKTFHLPFDFSIVDQALSENEILIICPHPMMTNKILTKSYDSVYELRDFSTNELMFISDCMITDYSSVVFEYMFMDKPIAFYCYDLEEYDRGFYLEYPDDLPGKVFKSQEEFIEFMKNTSDDNKPKREEFIRKYLSACDGNSGQRIANIIDDYININK